MTHKRIHPVDLMSQKTADMCILDVRTAAEVKAAGLPDCLHIPLHELTPERLQAEIIKSGKNGSHVYLLCQAGRRAEMAADQLKGNIDAELYVIEGGMNLVQQSNIDLVKEGKKVLPLDRQMRIAAGLMVVTGAALGASVNPAFYALSAFIGGGLVFAGVTNICPLTGLISKMPWNR
jgi:rhodanese-related sulfurtransferase